MSACVLGSDPLDPRADNIDAHTNRDRCVSALKRRIRDLSEWQDVAVRVLATVEPLTADRDRLRAALTRIDEWCHRGGVTADPWLVGVVTEALEAK